MEFVTWARLHRDLLDFAGHVPQDVSGVVGVPRSGMMVASVLAVHLHLPLTSVDELARGQPFYCAGRRLAGVPDPMGGRLLVLDDSAWSGRSMETALGALAHLDRGRLLAAAIYATGRSARVLDLYHRQIEGRRLFEWNVWNHGLMASAHCDLDGVICRDPQVHDDDGAAYLAEIAAARPLYRVRRVGAVVTCRLERWRGLTRGWLERHGVQAERLIMMDYPSAADRRRAGRHGQWKGEVYREDDEAPLFVESSLRQARQIREIAGKPVLCTETMELL